MRQDSFPNVRVLLIGPLPPPYGGIPTYVKDLYEAHIDGVEFGLFDISFPAWVAPLDRYGSLYRASLKKNGLFTTLKIVLYVLWSYPYLAYRIIKDRPHIIHIFPSSHWSYWRNWLYVLLAKSMGCRTVFHLLNAIDVFYNRVGRSQKRLIRFSFRQADVYLVQSKGLQSWLEQYCRKPCYGFLNGIHLDRVPSDCIPPAEMTKLVRPVGVTTGTLSKRKGTPQILEAVSHLHQKGVDLSWVFIGMGDVNRYRQQAEELHIADRVIFTGPVTDEIKWQYLKNSDLFCLPSDAEGQPISILEAMAAGLPIISTAVGSIPEIITEGKTGFVVPVDDNIALEQALLSMLKEERWKALGSEARRYLIQNHDIQHLFEHLGAVYHSMK